MVNAIPGLPQSVRHPPGILFTFIAESRSESSRNPVHLHPGIAFTLARNTHRTWQFSRWMSSNRLSQWFKWFHGLEPIAPNWFTDSG